VSNDLSGCVTTQLAYEEILFYFVIITIYLY